MMCSEGEVSYNLFKAGSNRDGWWDNADLVNQLRQVIPIFESLHPGKIALFCFDQNQNHHAQSDDALIASCLRLNDGGNAKKVYLLRNTFWGPQRTCQSMTFLGAASLKALEQFYKNAAFGSMDCC